jgi:protoporphyrinogen IX oxidase
LTPQTVWFTTRKIAIKKKHQVYNYIKALHIIFIVTWFAGMFYMPRLFIYSTEAGDQPEPAKSILRGQFAIMKRRLWYGITWPSAILTIFLGIWVMVLGNWHQQVFEKAGEWLLVKLIFVALLYAYFGSLHHIFRQQHKGNYKYSSNQLRIWNEVATVLLFAIIMLVVVKQSISLAYGLGALFALIAVLMVAIRLYRKSREKST